MPDLFGKCPRENTLKIVGSEAVSDKVGTRFAPGQAKCAQIDADPPRIGLRYPADVGLAGDCRHVKPFVKNTIREVV
jgi:thiamine pyrophosphate-dependent acetolactate synthase large subunit-like protein